MLFLTSSPLWLSGFLLIVPPTLLAMAGPFIIRRMSSLSRLRTNNEVAGFKFATVGVLYAVLLAFAVIVVWEKFNDADNRVAAEAGAAATVYRLANGIEGEQGEAIRTAMSRLPQFGDRQGLAGDAARQSKPRGHRRAERDLRCRPQIPPRRQFRRDFAGRIAAPGRSGQPGRRARLVAANGTVPGVVWLVLFSGAILTIAFTFFFGTENIRAQVAMTGVLSILIFSGMLTIISINRPFTGPVNVGPEPLLAVLKISAPRPRIDDQSARRLTSAAGRYP